MHDVHTEDAPEPGAAQIEEFMAVAGHDLRNPIAVMRASAQMAQRQLARGDIDAAAGRLAVIISQSDRVAEMLETFLDAARIGANRLRLRLERTELRDVVQSALAKAREASGERADRRCELDIPDGCYGVWDRARLERAVSALLANALLYGDPSVPVQVRGARHDDQVRLTVMGGGPGPDGDEAGHLFERFYRGATAASAGTAGSGLGLYVSRGIARALGGDVRHVEGDHFQLELPLARS
jgi:signal transduction histidine kinase